MSYIARLFESKVEPTTVVEKSQKQLWADAFFLGQTGESLLFRPEAIIDLQGQLSHGDDCPCGDGLLTTNIECICGHEDYRLPYDTNSVDYLYQLRLAVTDVIYEFKNVFVRTSELFEDIENVQDSLRTVFTRAIKLQQERGAAMNLTSVFNDWDRVKNEMIRNTDWYRAYTHLRIQDDLSTIVEEENLKKVLDAAFDSPKLDDEEPDQSPSVEEMYDIMARIVKEQKENKKKMKTSKLSNLSKYHCELCEKCDNTKDIFQVNRNQRVRSQKHGPWFEGIEEFEDDSVNDMMEGIMALYEHGIFHGKVETTTLKTGDGRSKKARHRGKDEVVLLL